MRPRINGQKESGTRHQPSCNAVCNASNGLAHKSIFSYGDGSDGHKNRLAIRAGGVQVLQDCLIRLQTATKTRLKQHEKALNSECTPGLGVVYVQKFFRFLCNAMYARGAL